MVEVAEEEVEPFSVTDHVVPEGRPVSVNVTVYLDGIVTYPETDTLSDALFATYTSPLELSKAAPKGSQPTVTFPNTA